MCKFFSFVSDAKGNYFYFNNEQRKLIIKKELKRDSFVVEEPDSHSTIARFYFRNGHEDRLNKYEYCPLTKTFTVDQINIDDDSKKAEKFVKALDFKSIVEELVIKEIENPLLVECAYVDEYFVHLLKKWASVRDSVWYSVRDSVGDSVWYSVGDSVGASVRASVRDSVGASVRDSVGAYESSFYTLKKEQWKYCEDVNFEGCDNPFQSCIDLWEHGLVPSFDGKTWRLHSGQKAEIVFSITKEDLQKYGE